jgi:CBS domain-containing protein
MAANGTDWVAVCEGDRLRGWVGANDLDGAATVGEIATRPFRAVVRPDTTLKAALDGVVTTRTRVAVAVDDDDRYLGMLTIDDLAAGVTT